MGVGTLLGVLVAIGGLAELLSAQGSSSIFHEVLRAYRENNAHCVCVAGDFGGLSQDIVPAVQVQQSSWLHNEVRKRETCFIANNVCGLPLDEVWLLPSLCFQI